MNSPSPSVILSRGLACVGRCSLPVGEDDPGLARGESHSPPGRGGEGGAAVCVRPGPVRGPSLAAHRTGAVPDPVLSAVLRRRPVGKTTPYNARPVARV